MATLEARIRTERATRYLVQLCRHANEMGRHRMLRLPAHVAGESHAVPDQVTAEWTDTHGTISVDGGSCTLRATEDALLLRIETEDGDRLRQLQEMITRNLIRFSRREPLTVNWQPNEGNGTTPATDSHTKVRHGRRRRTVILIVVGVLAVAAHVVLGGAVLAAPQWTGLAADAILLIVVVKAAAIALGYLAHRRRKTARTR